MFLLKNWYVAQHFVLKYFFKAQYRIESKLLGAKTILQFVEYWSKCYIIFGDSEDCQKVNLKFFIYIEIYV